MKLTSRKFWICVAAFLASIGTSIAGLHSENEIIVVIGTVSTIISAAIYAFAEAWVDSRGIPRDCNFEIGFKQDKKDNS